MPSTTPAPGASPPAEVRPTRTGVPPALAYALRRLLATIPVLLAATILTFVLVDRAGDPMARFEARQPPPPASTLDAIEHDLYLDRSLPERYWLWLTGIGDTNGDIGLLRGEWGPSVRGIDIGDQLRDRALVTLRLVSAATVLGALLAVGSGVASAIRRSSRVDNVLSVLGYLALAMPTFWLAALAKEGGVWVNDRVGARWLSTVGASSPRAGEHGWWYQLVDAAGHLALPTTVLVLTGYAIVSRHQRASMLEVLDSDYVRLARAKGLRERTVIRRHALRTALLPTTTLIALVVSGAVTGAIIVEQVFRWRGLGTFLLEAVGAFDSYAVMAFIVLSGIVVVLANLAADLLYAALDPRIRHG